MASLLPMATEIDLNDRHQPVGMPADAYTTLNS